MTRVYRALPLVDTVNVNFVLDDQHVAVIMAEAEDIILRLRFVIDLCMLLQFV
ncbi:MAG: hypothetical protein GY924_04165, partial [Planctomycetaceae bacterium]|nr:hypothetical protein [Planctomycetaceae bacterium]